MLGRKERRKRSEYRAVMQGEEAETVLKELAGMVEGKRKSWYGHQFGWVDGANAEDDEE